MPTNELAELLAACRAFEGGEDPPRQASGRFLEAAAWDPALLVAATAALPDLPPNGASWLALTLGEAVDRGADVRISGPAVFNLFSAWLAAAPSFEPEGDDDQEPELSPEELQRTEALDALSWALISHLAKMPECRAELVEDAAFCARLEAVRFFVAGTGWVRELVERSSGSLIVLHPPSRRGMRLRYENVGKCFHLFSLLQAAIGKKLPGGRRPDPMVAQVARGQMKCELMDQAWWHFGSPDSPKADIEASVWGELPVRSILRAHGELVILLWPMLLRYRSWDSSFFGPALDVLPADVTVEEILTKESANAWLEALGIEARRKWWPF